MKNLFLDTRPLDKRASTEFKLSSEILMENAARGMLEFLLPKLNSKSRILLVCGSGDNGADCLALARMLYGTCPLSVLLPLGAKSPLCTTQLERLKALASSDYPAQLNFLNQLEGEFDIILDGLFGAGFKGALNAELCALLESLNQTEALKIACDIPSGIQNNGTIPNLAFKADFTLTMGALKFALYLDHTKDFVGEVHLLHLGIQEHIFTLESPIKLLESSDFKPPLREKQNTNKGDFGHLCVLLGEKQGAGILCALSAFRSGCGLVSALGKTQSNLPFELMHTEKIPHNTTAIALGMGLGRDFKLENHLLQLQNTPLVLDADIFYNPSFKDLLQRHSNCILTPHPKEFTQILNALNLCKISPQDLQKDRIPFALEFSRAYPNAILVLKGANTIIAHKASIYINPFGDNALAKGGSGDVLAGMISGLLAQGYSPLDSAINGVLMHSFCVKAFLKTSNNFSLTPLDLIEQIRYI
ncbi:NAD(P)H-hydrate dehydratase [Helicobacter sp.]|uniref:NAD(P)H-hydrate dehydratase n=1 Tax=Helicobacter sp. TaxID=218 RepID=UPI0025BCE3FC|nr:NAD(P)H-hydrate dehydratase [Helicobacter sp.]MCI5969044.1 NAD(P)H-hydrate dehydratase [Helicobacter sp.]MDY2585340.1 NAD(P)H-hydrate dehydratase [Helicobacter sp.]